MPGAGGRKVGRRCRLVAVLLGNVGGLEGILCKVDGTARLEEQLELGLAGKVAVLLGANLAANKVGTEDGLLDFDLEKGKARSRI